MSTKELVEKVNEAFAAGSPEGFLDLCTEDVQWTMVGDKSVKGKENIRQWMSSVDPEPPTFSVDRIIAEGDYAAAYGDMTMKNNEGKEIPYSYCDVYRFREGKVVELTSYVVKTDTENGTGDQA